MPLLAVFLLLAALLMALEWGKFAMPMLLCDSAAVDLRCVFLSRWRCAMLYGYVLLASSCPPSVFPPLAIPVSPRPLPIPSFSPALSSFQLPNPHPFPDRSPHPLPHPRHTTSPSPRPSVAQLLNAYSGGARVN